MKNLFKITVLGILFFLLNSCGSQNGLATEKVTSLLSSGNFTFLAQKANPMGGDVINVLNSFPNSSASRILELDYGYTLQITENKIVVTLPYFGRMYNPSFDTSKNSYRFTSKDFKINQSPGKKGSTTYSFVLNDQQNIRKMYLEVFKNGKAYLSIDSNDRQPISYDGYIMENSADKK